MEYGQRVMQQGMDGDDVQELQIRLAGFRGTTPDGDFGPGTALQVVQFQRDVMNMASPTGIADRETLLAIDAFAEKYPIDFEKLACPCGKCTGFGKQRFESSYRSAKPKIERNYRYEYPGMHRMLLWAVRAVFLYAPEHDIIFTSGYRCADDNKKRGRRSTNHHGKAIDLDIAKKPGEDKRDDMTHCEQLRGIIVEKSTAQIGWNAVNRKALEPKNIAPTWVHYDVRCYEKKYLEDRFFCTSLTGLDRKLSG